MWSSNIVTEWTYILNMEASQHQIKVESRKYIFLFNIIKNMIDCVL